MRFLKNLGAIWHRLVLWAMVSVLFCAWVFGYVNDTRPEKKLVVFVQAPALADRELTLRLEEQIPQGIRMIRAHHMDYSLFDDEITRADVYILPRSAVEKYTDTFADADPDLPCAPMRLADGAPAWPIYDAAAGTGRCTEYITYAAPDGPTEDYFLVLSNQSTHLDDGLAAWLAERVYSID